MTQATVTYFHNSGFMVRTGSILLVFDYWRGEDGALPVESRLTERDFADCTQIVFFVSHAHQDHFDSVIYDFNYTKYKINYIVDKEVPQKILNFNICQRIHEGETVPVGPVTVTAFGSTDAGVSFYVRANGLTIFHAGDLNLWHWREERSLSEVRQAQKAFYDCVKPLESLPVDIAMFPLDPRQGGCYDVGANHFIMAVKPRVFFPMHWQDKPEVALDYCRRGRTYYTDTYALTRPREAAEITFTDTRVKVDIIAPQEKITAIPNRGKVELDNLSFKHPFAESDLPVDFSFGKKDE